jgi:hypothetical protein
MTETQLIEAIKQVDGLDAMTVNERLFASGLVAEFDEALIKDKPKARKILELLRVDDSSIEKILTQ